MKTNIIFPLASILVISFSSIALAQEAVDLGLSVKWASCNIGANNPSETGRYFAYGDVIGQYPSPGSSATWSGVGFHDRYSYQLDENKNLRSQYDAASHHLGKNWRMPTSAEVEELIDNCSQEWVIDYKNSGNSGVVFTSKKEGFTDKSIFLPAGGRGCGANLENLNERLFYWTSYNPSFPHILYGYGPASSLSSLTLYLKADPSESYGMPIRPVTELNSIEQPKQILQRLPNESDRQLQIRQEILDYLSSDKKLTVASKENGSIIIEEDGVKYHLVVTPYAAYPNIVYAQLYIISGCNSKYPSVVYQAVQNKIQEYRAIKYTFNKKDNYYVITYDVNLANSDNFIQTFDLTKSLLKKLYTKVLPSLCEQFLMYLPSN